jgi:hypothetical protein
MIKLFRNIRKNLLNQGKTAKYFKYAIGEIVLVVIGILIALQINDWNERQKQLKQEYKILVSLEADFIKSKERLSQTLKMQNNVIKKGSELIKMYEGKIPRAPNDTLMNYIAYGAYSWYREELLTGAYDAYINTGNSELIRNENLTKLMAEYFSILESGFEDQENSMDLLNNMQNIMAPVAIHLDYREIRPKIGLDTSRSPKEDMAIEFLFEQDAFFGLLNNRMAVEYLRLEIQKDLMVKIDAIIAILQSEIKRHT